MCLALPCKYSSHCWSYQSSFNGKKEKKRKKSVLEASAHFENLCPFFFKILPHVVAGPTYVRIIFIESFTVVKNKPDIQRKCFKIRVPERRKK